MGSGRIAEEEPGGVICDEVMGVVVMAVDGVVDKGMKEEEEEGVAEMEEEEEEEEEGNGVESLMLVAVVEVCCWLETGSPW